jgi:hypothetical protein
VLLAQLERLAARGPVLAVYEDAHWIDPTTLELLTLVIEQVQRLPVLLLITARSSSSRGLLTRMWPMSRSGASGGRTWRRSSSRLRAASPCPKGGGLLGQIVTLLLPSVMAAAQAGNLSVGGIVSQVIAVHKTGERWFEAELHRLQGEALLALCLIGIHPMFVSHF